MIAKAEKPAFWTELSETTLIYILLLLYFTSSGMLLPLDSVWYRHTIRFDSAIDSRKYLIQNTPYLK
jgi:hypothetical protein